jgi:O-antigen/teichoic acid export membrane protein
MIEQLKEKTINGFFWSFFSQFGRQILTLVITIFLARLLSPTEFGLIALVTALTGFASIFTELGYGSALIQKKDASDLDYSSVFWINIIIGVFLTLLFSIGSGLVVRFYDNPDLKTITILLSFNFLLNAITIVQRIQLVKDIQFKLLAKIELTAILMSGVLAIILAYNGFGVYSLVAQILTIAVVSNIILWYNSSWRPSFLIDKESIKSLNKFSINLMGNQIFGYWTKNLDNLLIGKYLGADALGIYSRSYSLLAYRVNSISKVLSRVMFPTLSNIQDDNLRIRNIYLKVVKMICFIVFPLIVGLYFTAENVIFLLFGEKWMAMVPVFKALSIFGFALAIGSVHGNIYLAKGKTGLQLKVGVFFKSLSIVAIIIGLKWGVLGVAYSLGVVSLLSQFPQIMITGNLIGLKLKEVIKALYKIFICAFLIGGIIWFIGALFFLSDVLLLITQILVGILSYLGFVYLVEREFVVEVLGIIKRKKNLKSKK